MSLSASTYDAYHWVNELGAEALRHRAVNHLYLSALSEATLPDHRVALADFARQYYAYSIDFPRYLTAVMSRLDDPGHLSVLLDNLNEESGFYGEEDLAILETMGIQRSWIVGVPHPELFKRFVLALGVNLERSPESDAVVCWRDLFMNVLTQGHPAEAIGAFGLGTEHIVKSMYQYVIEALKFVPDLDPKDTCFFVLHTSVDEHHNAALHRIACEFAYTEEGRVALRRGMLKVLNLRSVFWDAMLARALKLDTNPCY